MTDKLVHAWYHGHWALMLLWPLSVLYRCVTAIRRWAYQRHYLASAKFPVPVIVVGNITVGGAGKTPLTLALVSYLQAHGYKPAVVSRGYGGKTRYPALVTSQSTAAEVGDEPLLIYQQSGAPVVVSPVRTAAVAWLLEQNACDVVVCDDGLQHYALQRDIEIVVIDGERGLGNNKLLPQGPLREGADRLHDVDLIVINGQGYHQVDAHLMTLAPGSWQAVGRGGGGQAPQPPQRIHAVAGIGNPQRFFAALQQQGFEVVAHAFPDHHAYSAADLVFAEDLPVVMTAKDAVKCRDFAKNNIWQVPVVAKLSPLFYQQFQHKLNTALQVCATDHR